MMSVHRELALVLGQSCSHHVYQGPVASTVEYTDGFASEYLIFATDYSSLQSRRVRFT
jgi:hypothetical protein